MRINFDFDDLNTFLALADTESFQKAAASLAVSQSAVTRRIQKLETTLGVRLFDRTTRSLRLTIHGKEMVTRAQTILNEASDAMCVMGDSTTQFQYQRNQVVSLAITPTLTRWIFSGVLTEFQQACPDTRVDVLDVFANDVVEAVSTGDADLGIGFIGIPDPGLEFRHLMDDQLVVAFHPAHEFSRINKISWKSLAPHKIIVPTKGSGNRLLIDNTLARKNLMLEWHYQARHSSTMQELARTGSGIAILPASAISPDDKTIQSRPLVNPVVSRPIGIIYRRGKSLSPAAQILDLKVQSVLQSARVD